MYCPQTPADLQALIDDAVSEDLHLDYKSSAVFDKTRDEVRLDLAKDTSAFANSDGGVIIYGVVESGHIPQRLDDGVDHAKWNRERIENLINSSVSPRIDGVRIRQIPLSAYKSAYALEVPKSFRGPHQERINFRFYKRFNFVSEPMEAYEIDDVRNRRDVVLPLISVDVDIHRGVVVHLVISNIGDIPAEEVIFKLSSDVPGLTSGNLTPNVMTKGTAFLPPGKVFKFFLGSAIEKVGHEGALRFEVEVSYYNRRAGHHITDTFKIDLSDYINSAIVYTDTKHLEDRLAKCFDELVAKIGAANDNLQAIATIAGATGLDLSVTTVRNLQHLLAHDNAIERIPASSVGWQAFAEVLGVDRTLAFRLAHFVRWSHGRLNDLEGMTPEILERARAAFIFENEYETPESSTAT